MKVNLIILIFVVVGLACYSYSLGGEFIWDDYYFVLRNSAIHSLNNIASFFTDPTTLASGKLGLENYRPLVTFSYALDYMFWGLNTFGYHLTNTILHILNSILVFLMVRKIAKGEIACLTALIFLVHPAQTEAVSWISGRSNVLFVFFYLAAFITYIDFVIKKDSVSLYVRHYGRFSLFFDSSNLFFLYSLLLFSLSLLSKEAAATLPIMIVLHDSVLRREGMKKKIARWLPYFAIFFIYFLSRFHILGKISQRGYWEESILETSLTVPKIIKIYMQILVLPLNLCVDRHISLVKSLVDAQFLSGALLIALLLGLFFIGYRRAHNAAFFAAWFMVTLLPFLNIFPINILIAERFLYLPIIGIAFLFSAGLFKFTQGKSQAFYPAVILIATILSFLTMNRNLEWKDEFTLFKSGVKVEPWNARMQNSLGVAYMTKGDMEKAEAQFKKALILDIKFSYNYIDLGKLYFKQEKYDLAEDIVKSGLEIAPDEPELLNLMAVLYAQKSQFNEAEEIFRRIIKHSPKFFDAHLNLGRLLEDKGAYEDALNLYLGSLPAFRTGYEEAMLWLRIAGVYEKQDLTYLAEELYRYIMKKYPNEEAIRDIAAERLHLNRDSDYY